MIGAKNGHKAFVVLLNWIYTKSLGSEKSTSGRINISFPGRNEPVYLSSQFGMNFSVQMVGDGYSFTLELPGPVSDPTIRCLSHIFEHLLKLHMMSQ